MRQERIKDRVLKRAARSWGFTDLEMETSFDPIIAMLLNALSYELEKVAHELEDSKTRVVERVLEVMFPEVLTGAKPARAIMHASPIEDNIKVSLLNQMSVNRRIHNIYNPLLPLNKEIILSPTLEVKLSCAEIKFIAYERNLFKISNLFYKDAIADYNNCLPAGEVILGIELKNTSVTSLDDLLLYIDIKNMHQKEMFLYYLKQMKCFHDGEQIDIEEGYNVKQNSVNLEDIITKNYTHLTELMQEVNEFYYDHFYTLKNPLKFKPFNEYSNEYIHFENVTNNNDNLIIWIKMVFPESLIPQIIDNITFTTNCFPVINKKRHTINKTFGDFLSYVALDTDNDVFLDIDNVTDVFENRYEIKDFTDSVIDEGNAVLRMGGVSRFDSRSASELLQNLLDLLKDESSSFAGLGKDFMNRSLVEINQLLASVEQQAKESSFSMNSTPYLMIKPKTDVSVGKSFTINYWSTAAEDGNDIKAGTILDSKEDLSFFSKETILVTNTVGGTSKQNNKDRILSYRDALLTRGRIVTFTDIKAFAFNHFKSCITHVKIEKGTRKEISVKAGFSRTVDISITINPPQKDSLSTSEWNYLCESFLKNLKNKSSNVFPFRLFFE